MILLYLAWAQFPATFKAVLFWWPVISVAVFIGVPAIVGAAIEDRASRHRENSQQ